MILALQESFWTMAREGLTPRLACKAPVLLAFYCSIADRLFLQRSWRQVPRASLGLNDVRGV